MRRRGSGTFAEVREISCAQSKSAMIQMLYSARSIDNLTVADLLSRYQVDRRVAEYELTIARQKRAAMEAEDGKFC